MVKDLEKQLEEAGLEIVMGLETHVRLNTKTKLFCACPNSENSNPNTNICSVCTGQMGVLPAINQEAIRKAIRFGKAIDSSMKNKVICWDRKHYEYPDLPKNFQLTQFQKPIVPDGEITCYRDNGSTFTVEIEQGHLEEDAAKLIHERKQTLVDFNKGGVPLIEVVTKPCLRNIKDAATYAQYLQRIVQNLGISGANLEKGEFKSDASVSLRKIGTDDLNPRTEIKNLNSFKFMVDALNEEVTKQLSFYKENGTFKPDQTTVLWDEALKHTKTMRKKEFAADYRFALEPDIPFVNIEKEISEIHVDKELLPYAIEKIMISGGVRPQDAKFFTSDANRSNLFLAVNGEMNDTLFVAKTLLNNLKPEDYSELKDTKALTEMFGELKNENITIILLQNAIKEFLKDYNFDFQGYFKANSISHDALLESVAQVILENESVSEEIRNGNEGKAGILVGKVIQKIGKGASGKIVRTEILSQLKGGDIQLESSRATNKKNESQLDKDLEEEHRFTEIIVKEHYRSHLISELSKDFLNESVTVSGWVASVRDHGELVFIDLRDNSYEVLQIRLDREHLPNLDLLSKIKAESVIMVTGEIIERSEDDFNKGIRSGELELNAKELSVLNASNTLPFEIKRAAKTHENVRFTYKYLDHRSSEARKALINRHRVIKLIRDVLDEQDFIEVETPVLTAGTDEGAREFIVPSRKHAGQFYTLPQAPQQFKQMLMVGGIEKYFQLARCFRDEDSRGDRQPEFTQLDIEMAFVSMQDILDLNTNLFNKIVHQVYGKKWKLFPFQVLTYADSMYKYGCDRPDLRFGLEMQDITHIVKETEFQVFSKPIEDGGIVKCIKVSSDLQKKRLSKGQIEKLTSIAQEHGLGGLAYIIVNEDELQSPIIKFLGEDICANIIKETKAIVGDIVFFSAASYKVANTALDAVRQELGKILKLINPKELHPAWIIDFPFFEKTEEDNWTFTHNPFSMPKLADLNKHLNGEEIGDILAQQYDLVLNGYEIGGGSIRAHKAEILEATFMNMGYDKEGMMKSVGEMYKAFHFGAPPHGGIAWGVDRLMMILEKRASIRDVMAFPKTGSGEDLLFNSPSALSEKKVQDANVKVLLTK